jgi:hypothetical protein
MSSCPETFPPRALEGAFFFTLPLYAAEEIATAVIQCQFTV